MLIFQNPFKRNKHGTWLISETRFNGAGIVYFLWSAEVSWVQGWRGFFDFLSIFVFGFKSKLCEMAVNFDLKSFELRGKFAFVFRRRTGAWRFPRKFRFPCGVSLAIINPEAEFIFWWKTFSSFFLTFVFLFFWTKENFLKKISRCMKKVRGKSKERMSGMCWRKSGKNLKAQKL